MSRNWNCNCSIGAQTLVTMNCSRDPSTQLPPGVVLRPSVRPAMVGMSILLKRSRSLAVPFLKVTPRLWHAMAAATGWHKIWPWLPGATKGILAAVAVVSFPSVSLVTRGLTYSPILYPPGLGWKCIHIVYFALERTEKLSISYLNMIVNPIPISRYQKRKAQHMQSSSSWSHRYVWHTRMSQSITQHTNPISETLLFPATNGHNAYVSWYI